MITWVFIPLIGISAGFAYERQRGTLRRLLTTPTGKGTYLLGTILGNVLWALVQMTLLVTFGALVMKVNWADNPAALAVIMTASALSAAALGTMLGTMVKTDSQASGLSIMLGMVMALLGGCWYPIELFPEVVRNIVKAGHAGYSPARAGSGGYFASSGCPDWLCSSVLRDRYLAVQVRIKQYMEPD
jgi:ABC-2 type transport system permease protein